nr:hypothetical protein Hi04_10k_c3826_00007 [uncultured bacterium]
MNKDLFGGASHTGTSAVGGALAGLGIFCALVALGFTAAKRGRLLRPPSQAQLVLFYEMVHAWTRFFVPAVTLAFASIAFFVVSLAYRAASDSTARVRLVPLAWPLTTIALICAAAFAIGLGVYFWQRPRLGTPD